MAGYYNPPPNYGGGPYPPPYSQQQPPPQMGYNQYSPPQTQYSPTGFNAYGLEPTTPVLDQNQINYFFNEVNRGNIPTLPSAVSDTQAYPPPPQLPPQLYAPQPQSYQQQQYGAHSSYTSPVQQSFQPPPPVHYTQTQDVVMAGISRIDGEASEDDAEFYSPPISAAHPTPGNVGRGDLEQAREATEVIASQPTQEQRIQPPRINPFKPLSQIEDARSNSASQQLQAQDRTALLASKKKQAEAAMRHFQQENVGYPLLIKEPIFNEFDRQRLRELSLELGISLESQPQPQREPQLGLQPEVKPVQQAKGMVDGEQIPNLKRILQNAGLDVETIDDAMIATLANSLKPALVARNGPVEASTTVVASPPVTEVQAENADRSSYLARLRAAKMKSSAQDPATATSLNLPQFDPALQPSTSTKSQSQQGSISILPGVATPTPKPAVVKNEVLQRKLQAMRAQQQAKAQQAKQTTFGTEGLVRPVMISRTESMSSMNYDSEQVSARSGSEAEMVSPTPEEDEDEDEDEDEEDEDEDEDSEGEIVEDSRQIQVPAIDPVTVSAQPSTEVQNHNRVKSNQSNASSLGHPSTSRSTGASKYGQKGIASSSASFSPRGPQQQDSRKRPSSSAFGSPWDPRSKRPYPPPTTVPEPVVIDISSEEYGESDEEDDALVNNGESSKINFQPPRQQRPTPRQPWTSHSYSSPSSAFATPAINTPDPVSAARSMENARQKALLEEKRQKVLREIAEKEREKQRLSAASNPPGVQQESVISPLVASLPSITRASPSATARAISGSSRAASQPRNTSSPLPSPVAGRAGSVARLAARKAIDESLRNDQAQLEALQLQMEKLQQDIVRKNAQKAALAEELEDRGINTEGMSHAQMQGIHDGLLQEADEENELVQGGFNELLQTEDKMHIDEATAVSDNGSEEGEVQESSGTESEGEIDEDQEDVLHKEIGEADDPMSMEENRRIRVYNISYAATRENLITLLQGFDIQGLSYPQKASGRPAGHAFIDFPTAEEAARAINQLARIQLNGRTIRANVYVPKPKKPQIKQREQQSNAAEANGQEEADPESHTMIEKKPTKTGLSAFSSAQSPLWQPQSQSQTQPLAAESEEEPETESDDNDDAMSTSESSSEDNGAVLQNQASTLLAQQPPVEDESENSETSDDSDSNQDEAGDEMDVSLKDIEAEPIDDDAVSEEEFDVDLLDASSEESDEDGEIEEDFARQAMPQEESEHDSDYGEEEAELPEAAPELVEVSAQNAVNETTPEQPAIAEMSQARLQSDIVVEGEDGDDDDFYEPSISISNTENGIIAATEAAEGGEDESFYDPGEDEDMDAESTQMPTELGLKIDSDPDLDAALEAAFAEQSPATSINSVAALDNTDTAMPDAESLTASTNKDVPVDSQPARSPLSGGGIPGLESHHDESDAAMDVSEEGEIVSESGEVEEDEEEEYEPPPPTRTANHADNAVLPSSLFRDETGPTLPFHDPNGFAPYDPGRDVPKGPRAEVSNKFNYPTVSPRWDPLGNHHVAETTSFNKFTPYQSALKGFKFYRYHPSYSKDVAGGIKSLTFSHQINAMQPLCVTELGGEECADNNCPGQHFKDIELKDQDIIRQIGTINDLTKTNEVKKRWAEGLRQLIVKIRDEGIQDPVAVANRVVEYRREFFGGSILEMEIKSHVEDESTEEGELSG